jgi:hypothetical protein
LRIPARDSRPVLEVPATNISRAPTSIPAAFGSNTGRSSLCFVSAAWASRPVLADYRPMSFSLAARFLRCKQRPSCAIEDTLANGISWLPQLLTTALRTELGTTLMIGVLTTHHCHNGLLPSLVAPSQDAEMAWQNRSSSPLCPDRRPGPTLMSARPGRCGGHQVTGVPIAINNNPSETVSTSCPSVTCAFRRALKFAAQDAAL